MSNQKPMWQIMREAALEREENEVLKMEEDKRIIKRNAEQIIENSKDGSKYFFHADNGSKLLIQGVSESPVNSKEVLARFIVEKQVFNIQLPVDNAERWELISEENSL